MNFLFSSHYANPPEYGNPFRTHIMAKVLVGLGHKVTVVAAGYSHLRQQQPPRSSGIIREVHDGITYLFLPLIGEGSGHIFRVISFFSFVGSMARFRKAILLASDPDIVIEASTYVLPIFVSGRIASAAGAKLIYEVRDLWPASPIEISGKSKYHPLFLLINWAQHYALKNADCVVSTLRFADQYFAKEVLAPKMFAHIQNGVEVEQYAAQNTIEGDTFRAVQNIKARYSGCVGYTGAFGPANALQSLLAAAEELSRHDIAVVLIGKGPRRDEFDEFVAVHGLSNVHIFDAVPKAEIIPITKAFDLAFCGGVSRGVHHYGISPNKVFDYMMSETPILFCYNSQDDFVEQARCGITVRHASGETVAAAILKFFALPEDQKRQMGQNGRTAAMENYDYKILVNLLLDVVDRMNTPGCDQTNEGAV